MPLNLKQTIEIAITKKGWNHKEFGHRMGWDEARTTRKLNGEKNFSLIEMDQALKILDLQIVNKEEYLDIIYQMSKAIVLTRESK